MAPQVCFQDGFNPLETWWLLVREVLFGFADLAEDISTKAGWALGSGLSVLSQVVRLGSTGTDWGLDTSSLFMYAQSYASIQMHHQKRFNEISQPESLAFETDM